MDGFFNNISGGILSAFTDMSRVNLPSDRSVSRNNNTDHFPAVTEIGLEFVDLLPEEKVIISRYVMLKKKARK